ncbi:MAG: glycosyltransferase family protein [Nanoarchaeota archaeon]
MKYLFVITGIGFGHLMREEAIIRALLKKDKDAEIKVATYGLALNYFKKRFPLTELIGEKFPDTKAEIDATKVIFSNLFFPFQYFNNIKKIEELIEKFKPDILISDAEPEGIVAAKHTNIKSIYVYNLDLHNVKFEYNFGLYTYIIKKAVSYSHKNASQTIIPVLTQSPRKENKINYVNPIVRDLPSALPLETRLMKEFRFTKQPILVTIGGARFGLKLVKNIINVANYYDEHFIIFGVNIKTRSDNVTILPFQPNFLEYLKVSKALISLAGHCILSEVLVYKKPSLIFPIPNYLEQYQNSYLMNRYCIKGDMEKLGLIYLRNKINELLNNLGNLQNRFKNYYITKNGATEAAEIILQEISK